MAWYWSCIKTWWDSVKLLIVLPACIYRLEFYIPLGHNPWLMNKRRWWWRRRRIWRNLSRCISREKKGSTGVGFKRSTFRWVLYDAPNVLVDHRRRFFRGFIFVRVLSSVYHMHRLVQRNFFGIGLKSCSSVVNILGIPLWCCSSVETTGYLKNLLATWLTRSLAGVILGWYRHFIAVLLSISPPSFVAIQLLN